MRHMAVLDDGASKPSQHSPLAAAAWRRPDHPLMPEGLREIGRRAAGEAERKALADVLERVHWNRAVASRMARPRRAFQAGP